MFSERLRGCAELVRPGNAVAASVLTFTGGFVAAGAGVVRPPTLAAVRSAIVAPATLPPLAILIALVNLGALVAYTELFKGLPGIGNLVVAYLTGSTFLFGGAAIGAPLDAAVRALLAGVATLAREIVMDIEDVAGDCAADLRTLPIVVGERRALLTGLPADALMLHATVRSFDDPASGQRRLKLGTFLAATAFVIGRSAPLLPAGAGTVFANRLGAIIKKNITGSPLLVSVR
ncbi:MAG: UbiA family prenyltransferase [Haloferacaceae archaeon]